LPSPERLPQLIAEHVVNLIVEALDVNALIERVDINAVVDRVDINAIMEKVDINAIVERVDINAIVDRVDMNAIINELDIEAILEHTELGSLIARSTSNVVSEVLDVVRANGVTVDDVLARWVNRLLRRKPGSLPLGPPLLVPAEIPAPSTVAAPAPTPVADAQPGDGHEADGTTRPLQPTHPGSPQ
jgi:hypothetical protein